MIFQNAQALITYAKVHDIRLTVKGSKLLIDAPRGFLSSELKRCLVEHKQSLIFMLSHHGFSRDDLKREAGEDWLDIKDNPETIKLWANMLHDCKLMDQGIAPPSFTETTHCSNCGDVPMPPALTNGGQVLACMWCYNRAKGLPTPRF